MFFQSIYQMITAGTDLNINIRKVNNSLSVAVMPRRNSLKEDTRQNMVPLVVNGTPTELDMGFLQTILQPIQKVQGLLANAENFEKQAENNRYKRYRDCLSMRKISRNRQKRLHHRPNHPRLQQYRPNQRKPGKNGKRWKSSSRRLMMQLPQKGSPKQ